VTGRIAVVTGGSTGIGEASARALAAEGWRCVLVARRVELLERIASEIGGEAEPCDLLDRRAIEDLGRRILERHGRIGLLLNNAGALARGTFVDIDLDEMERVTRLNYLSGVIMTRALLPGLLAAGAEGGAHVVDLASTSGLITFPAGSAYSASKHAQVAFSRSLRAALIGTGVDVHVVMPGFVRTEGFPQSRFFRSLLGRRFVIGPERVARTIVDAIAEGREETVVPRFPYAAGGLFQALLPSATTRVMSWDRYVDESG
jgi:short-subunit dehydrogenase